MCFGGGPFDAADLDVLGRSGVLDCTTQVSGDDAVLAAYYATARALVYPSLYEGFGLPSLEAMIHRCPVAAAAVGSIPEIVGDAALLFDPTSTDAMVDALDQVLIDDALRDSLVERGLARVGAFSWEATTDATLAAYEQVLLGANP